MGSEKDYEFIEPAIKLLKSFEIKHSVRVASAHKTPEFLMDILKEYEDEKNLIYLTVAGRSNALSGFVDANTKFPVIACPPYSSKFGGADIFSSLRMPSGVGPMVVLDPKNAVLSAAKILSLNDPDLAEKLSNYRDEIKERVVKSDEDISDKN